MVDIEIFLGHGYTYCKMVQHLRSGSETYKVPAGWSPRGNKASVPHFDGALTAHEAVPYGHLKTEDTVASGVFLGLSSPVRCSALPCDINIQKLYSYNEGPCCQGVNWNDHTTCKMLFCRVHVLKPELGFHARTHGVGF